MPKETGTPSACTYVGAWRRTFVSYSAGPGAGALGWRGGGGVGVGVDLDWLSAHRPVPTIPALQWLKPEPGAFLNDPPRLLQHGRKLAAYQLQEAGHTLSLSPASGLIFPLPSYAPSQAANPEGYLLSTWIPEQASLSSYGAPGAPSSLAPGQQGAAPPGVQWLEAAPREPGPPPPPASPGRALVLVGGWPGSGERKIAVVVVATGQTFQRLARGVKARDLCGFSN